jgi:dTDP-4-dehydrorhamnose 3,5-epimerase-like enzyme
MNATGSSEFGSDPQVVELPRIPDARGTLTFLEAERHIPFAIRRAYWIYDVPGGEVRGAHAYRTLQEFVIAISGSFDVALDNGRTESLFPLNRAYQGLYVPALLWRQLRNFSTNAVALILASDPYDADDYVRSYDEFRELTRGRT